MMSDVRRLALVAVSFTEQRDGVSVYIENIFAQILRLVSKDSRPIFIDVYACGSAAVILETVTRKHLHELPANVLANVKFINCSRSDLITKYVFIPMRLQMNGPYDWIIVPNLQPLFLPGMRVLSLIHDLTYKRAYSHFSIWRQLYLDVLARFRLAVDASLGYISEATKNDLLEYYPSCRNKHTILVPNGLPFKMMACARPSDADVDAKLVSNVVSLLFVGRINRLKGFDLVVESCRQLDLYLLEHQDVSIVLNVVGKQTAEAEELFALATFERVELRLHGYVNDNRLNQLYKESAFCFFLSQNEGFGLPVLEAAWFGCIPILSNIPIFREIMGQDYPLFMTDSSSCESIVDFIHQIRSCQSDRGNILAIIERVVDVHRDGYERAASAVLDLVCSSEHSKLPLPIG